MKLVWIITFGLASLLASPISAQTPTPDSAAAQKSSQLPPVNVQAPSAATLTAPANGAGSERAAHVKKKGDRKRAAPPKPAFDEKEFWNNDATSQLK